MGETSNCGYISFALDLIGIMMKYLLISGICLLLHAAYSAAQHRTYLRLTEQEFTSLPSDGTSRKSDQMWNSRKKPGKIWITDPLSTHSITAVMYSPRCLIMETGKVL